MSVARDNQGGDERGVEVWRGSVNLWDCDEMGHMNVRHYLARAMEGLVGLAAALGMPRAFSPAATATLLVREHHVRFLREAFSRAPLHMRGWVAEMGETDARLILVLYHAVTGEPSASFQTVVSHITPADGRAFPWSRETLDRAGALTAPIPDFAAARSIDLKPVESQARLDRADALDLMTIRAGAVSIQDCDAFGRMRAEHFLAMIGDGVARLADPIRAAVIAGLDPAPARVGGAMIEYRLVYLNWPRAGDRVLVRSGLTGADHRTQRLVHWLLDPATGRPWGTSRAVAVTLDLDRRKIVPVSPEAQAALNAQAKTGLTL
jgi:acyl-CoA thioester hydrolase